MERPPEPKKDEQCPLLKIVTVKEMGEFHQPVPASPPSWSATSVKKSWTQKWPELVSASWMTLMLLGITFLVFYALGMGMYKRQPLFPKYGDGKQSSNVFLHHIINKGNTLPLDLFSPYLELMAVVYPNLRFNVFFLVDDGIRYNYYMPRHTRLSSRLFGLSNKDEFAKHSCVKDLERSHHNINITIMSLSKFMAVTPLRFKWRTIPLSYLTFYARIFSVWQNGGIGIDFMHSNLEPYNSVRFERRVHEIFKNHNKGLPIPDYNLMLQSIDDEEDISFKCLKQVLNETVSMFNSLFSFGMPTQTVVLPPNDTTITRTHRFKRDSSNFYEIVSAENTIRTGENKLTDSPLNVNPDEKKDNLIEKGNTKDPLKIESSSITSQSPNVPSETTIKVDQASETKLIGQNKSTNISEAPQAVLFYDFSIMSDKVGRFLLREPVWPTLMFSGFNSQSDKGEAVDKNNATKNAAELALASDGMFIAATNKMNPFLGILITAGFQRMRPEFAIQDTLITQCSGAFNNAPFCSIYKL